MSQPFSNELLVGIGAVAIAAAAIFMFIRAGKTGGGSQAKADRREPGEAGIGGPVSGPHGSAAPHPVRSELLRAERHLVKADVEKAGRDIRTLTLQRELLGIVLKRLFEAEDEGEITREERLRLSRDYEEQMKRIGEELKRSELIVTLNELEALREELVKKFEATLSSTQGRINAILGELKLEAPKEPAAEEKARRPRAEAEEAKAEEKAEAEQKHPRRGRSEVEEKLEQLRKEVQKELEELDKLELES